jgi:hypothetical protein
MSQGNKSELRSSQGARAAWGWEDEVEQVEQGLARNCLELRRGECLPAVGGAEFRIVVEVFGVQRLGPGHDPVGAVFVDVYQISIFAVVVAHVEHADV